MSLRRALWVWKSPTLSGIDQGIKVKVWEPPATGPNSKQIWAPELHFINGKWYIYYAASNGKNARHRMFVLEAAGEDALGAYKDKGQITSPDDKWAIDGTVLQKEDGGLYFIWSGWPGARNGLQNLYIAPMNNPWTISGERVLLSTPTCKWEGWINEGPQVLERNGKIFVVYSANASWTERYSLGLLTCNGSDVLNPESWTKAAEPVFKKYSAKGQGVYCVGHCSFTQSPDGREDWLVYHGKDDRHKGWIGRSARAQKFGWNEDGTPDFGQPLLADTPVAIPSGELGLKYLLSDPARPRPLNGVWRFRVAAYIPGVTRSDPYRFFRCRLVRRKQGWWKLRKLTGTEITLWPDGYRDEAVA
jgi:GH43 family beta-xylosidase